MKKAVLWIVTVCMLLTCAISAAAVTEGGACLEAETHGDYGLSKMYTLNDAVNTQGFAVSGDYAFQADKFGHVYVYNLASETPEACIGQFDLGSYSNKNRPDGYDYPAKGSWTNHANSMVFGAQKFDESDPFPLLYVVTGNGGQHDNTGAYVAKCAVERILYDAETQTWHSELVQTIEFNDVENIPAETDAEGNVINPYKDSNIDMDGNSTLLNMWNAETGTFPYVSGNGYDASLGYEKVGWGWPASFVDSDPTEETEGKFYLFSARFRTTEVYEGYNTALYGLDSYYEDNAYIITEFNLPELPKSTSAEDGYGAIVTLYPKDITDQFTTEYNMHFTQGGTMKQGRIYYSYGNKCTTEWTHNGIQVFDVVEQRLVSTVKLCDSVCALGAEAIGDPAQEVEALSFWGDTLLLSGRNGSTTLYQFDYLVSSELAVEHTCTEDGNIAYYYCTGCGKYYSDAACTTELESIVDPASHVLTKVEAKAATETENGNIEYYVCSVCKKLYADAEGKTEITEADTIVLAKGSSPATGDSFAAAPWALLLALSAAGVTVLTVGKKRIF